jgi:hypothetical protein
MFSLFREGEGCWELVGEFDSIEELIEAASKIESYMIEMKTCGGSQIVFVS